MADEMTDIEKELAHETNWADQLTEWLDDLCYEILGDDGPADTEERYEAALKRVKALKRKRRK